MDEMTEEGDLRTLTAAYLHHLILPSALISKIVSLTHSDYSVFVNLAISYLMLYVDTFIYH